jgi:hypothetical protein
LSQARFVNSQKFFLSISEKTAANPDKANKSKSGSKLKRIFLVFVKNFWRSLSLARNDAKKKDGNSLANKVSLPAIIESGHSSASTE